MSNVGMLKPFLQLKVGLLPVSMKLFSLLVFQISTHTTIGNCKGTAANNRGDMILSRVLGTKMMVIVLKRDLTIMDCAARAPHCDTINYAHPHLLAIIDAQTFEAGMS